MTAPNTTEIVFIVDRSGSMKERNFDAEMRNAFDFFIDKQKDALGDCKVTLTQFDNKYDVVYASKPIAEVPPLVLEPRGGTALLDAIGRTINETGVRLAAMPEEKRPSRVMIIIVTDGEENASQEYQGDKGRARILTMIKHQEETYKWDFIFLGANQDAIAAARAIGISASNAVTYEANADGAVALMDGLSNNVLESYKSGGRLRYGQKSYETSLKATKARRGQ
jgi:uncharacterized protein YegL